MARFGPSGNSESFHQLGVKNTEMAAALTRNFGLDIYEYSFGHGVTMSSERAKSIGEAFRREGLEISVHAPYFINFANSDPDMIVKSFGWVEKSAVKVLEMGGRRVVFHPATQGSLERSQAHSLMLENIKRMADVMADMPAELMLCAETMGKVVQMGTVAEICDVCNLSDRIYPCVDFGHINAREQGILRTKKDFEEIFRYLDDHIDAHKVDNMHIHFSKIAYSAKGEIKHLNFDDTFYGPDYHPLVEVLHERNSHAYCICESAGNQAEDAKAMKDYYQSL